MCFGNQIQNIEEKLKNPPHVVARPNAERFQHIFQENQREIIQRRAQFLRRLTLDPFFHLMNVTRKSRWWMVRHTPWLEEEALRGRTILQYFEEMPRESALHFFRMRNAPEEMITIWENKYPPTPPPQPANPAVIVEPAFDTGGLTYLDGKIRTIWISYNHSVFGTLKIIIQEPVVE